MRNYTGGGREIKSSRWIERNVITRGIIRLLERTGKITERETERMMKEEEEKSVIVKETKRDAK